MALEFGCEFLYEEKKYIYTNNICMMTEVNQGCYSIFVATPKGFARSSDTIEINENYPIKILGKPITLAVILLAIIENDGLPVTFLEAEKGEIGHDWSDMMFRFRDMNWNLSRDNFNDQSEETKMFIWGLLVK